MGYRYLLMWIAVGVGLLSEVELASEEPLCPPTTTAITSPSHPNITLTLVWPETKAGTQAYAACPCGNITGSSLEDVYRFASRRCEANQTTGATWDANVDASQCNFTDVLQDLCQASTLSTPTLVLEELYHITEAQAGDLAPVDVAVIVGTLETVSEEAQGDEELSDMFLTIVDEVVSVREISLVESNEDSNSSQRLLELLERVSEAYPIPANQSSVRIPRANFAVAVQRVDWTSDDLRAEGQSFHVDPVENSTELSPEDLELTLGRDRNASASIFLPAELFRRITADFNLTASNSEAYVTVAYKVFASNTLFQGRGAAEGLLFNNTNFPVDRLVIAASVSDGYGVEEQEDPGILITFLRDPEIASGELEPLCTFWDFSLDGGFGGWSGDECEVEIDADTIVVCECEHLTHFSFLSVEEAEVVDVVITAAQTTLEAIIFVGGAIASFCMVAVLLTYTTSKKLRATAHGKLLINLCSSLLCIYLTLILADLLPTYRIPCAVAAAFLHYFMLVMGLAVVAEAIILYLKLVRVFTHPPKYYTFKAAIVSWSLPIIVVGITVGVGHQDYLDAGGERGLCIAIGWSFIFGYAVPLALLFVFNWIVFVIIMISLCTRHIKMKSEVKSRQPKAMIRQQFWAALSLSVLLGLGWGFGLAVSEQLPTIAYYTVACLFVVFACLQGLLIFLLQVVRSQEARKHWKGVLFSCWEMIPSTSVSVSTRTTSANPGPIEKYKLENGNSQPNGSSQQNGNAQNENVC